MNFILTILSAINLSAQINIENYVGKNILASYEIKHYEEAAEISKKLTFTRFTRHIFQKQGIIFIRPFTHRIKKVFRLKKIIHHHNS
jgi:hypothetical protein